MDSDKSGTARAQPIEFDRLLDRCMGRVELMERVLSNFRVSAEKEIGQLTAAIDHGEQATILASSHKLKGTSLTVSASALAGIAEQLHAAALHECDGELASFSCMLLDEFEAITQSLDARKLGGDR